MHDKKMSVGGLKLYAILKPYKTRLFFFFFIILASICVSLTVSANAHSLVYFVDPLESKSLNQFFGKERGSYFYSGLLIDQAKSGLEVDFAASAHAISQMPSLGDGNYLDAGGGYFTILRTEGTDLILKPSGEILAAAFYWTPCWDCGNFKDYRLTIFVKNTKNLPRVIAIFKNLVKQDEIAEYAEAKLDPISTDFSDTRDWGNQPIQIDIPTNIVFLKSAEIRVKN